MKTQRFRTLESRPVAELKEFERRFKFKPRFKLGYQMFQDLSRRLI